MFETDNRPKVLSSLFQYFLQLILSYPVTLIVSYPFERAFSKFGYSGTNSSGIYFAGYAALICLFVGPLVGWTTGRLASTLIWSGPWVWVLPTMIVGPETARELLQNQSIPWLPETLFATSDNEGLGVFLFTLPMCSAIGYSIGMFLVSRAEKGIRRRPFTAHLLLFALASITFFTTLIFLHNFEQERLERWGRVRSIANRLGLQLSPDALVLCSRQSVSPSHTILLKRGTYVEVLEHRGCNRDQFVDAGAVQNTDSFLLGRVRVLNGPHAGLKGWVLEDGLLKH